MTRSGGLSAKYILPARGDEALLETTFQNNRQFPLHHEFLRTVFPQKFPNFTAEDLRVRTEVRDTRDYFVGALQLVKTNQGFEYVFSIRTSQRREELLRREEVLWAFEKLAAVFGLRPLAYAPDPTGSDPLAREEARSWGDDAGFPIFFGQTLVDESYVPYTLAVGYGRVRVFDRASFDAANARGSFTFQDIAVIDHAPRDIEGVVGGVITAAPQGALSHVSIRTARRRTPNAYVANAMEAFEPFDGKLVRLEVGERRYTIREVKAEEAETFWAENRPQLPALPPVDRSYDGLDSLAEMDFSGAVNLESRFGGKATNLARLQTILDGENAQYREQGFAIPMSYYLEFMEMNRLPSVLDLGRQVSYREYLEEFLAQPEFQTDSEARSEALSVFRDQARALGRIPGGLVERLGSRVREVFGTDELMVRFRSSSNVEDLLGFTGAGLYESTSVCVADSFDADEDGPSICDDTKDNERTIERALKKVWTSLWTFRAHEERAFYQIPQAIAAMGILVNRAFLDETANGVAFTGDPLSPRGNCYVVTAQVGEESVVSPEPGKLPERDVIEVVDGEVVRIVRAQPSTLVPRSGVVLSDDELRELGALMWHIEHTFPIDSEGRSREDILLDLEFKIEPDGSLAVKQVRPFLIDTEGIVWPRFELEIPAGTVACGGLNVVSPSRPILEEYLAKSTVRFKPGLVELPSRDCVFSGELFDEVLVGPERELAIPEGRGLFRVETRPDPGGTVYSFSYRQEFSLPGDRSFELRLFDLDFISLGGGGARGRIVLDERYLTFDLKLLGFVSEPGVDELTIAYSSCEDRLLPLWDIDVVLDDGVRVTLRERFRPPDNVLLTGPASLSSAEVSMAGERQLISDYWDLVYASSVHNTFVKYWILLDRAVTVPGVAGEVHVLEIAAPDAEDAPVNPRQEAAAAYLDENFQVLARPGVVSFEKEILGDVLEPRFVRGDANADGLVDVSDAVRIIGYLFLQGEPLDCRKAGDADDDGKVNINDAIRTLRHLFKGAAMPLPREFCGPDPTPDALTCERFPTCL